MSIKSVMPSNHLILCHPLLLPSIVPIVRVFSDESALHIRWPKYWSFSFSISPSNEYSGLISFRMDWLDLLAVQGTLKTLKSLVQHHSSKASILWHSAFFVVQLSHPYMTTRSYTVLLGEVEGALGLCCGKQSSLVAACRLNCPLACGVLVPRPGIEPEFPALEGEFLTTGSPEKPPCTVVKCQL